jgi:hypothetical protein
MLVGNQRLVNLSSCSFSNFFGNRLSLLKIKC